MIRVHEGAEIHRLAAQVCTQAIKDMLFAKSSAKRAGAFLFLVSPDFQVWSEAGRLEFADPYKVLSNLRKVKAILQKRKLK
jgi:hypothetical protein